MRPFMASGLLLLLAGCVSGRPAPVAVPSEVEVTLNCRVQSDGTVADCRLVRERPEGYGLGAEALAAAGNGLVRLEQVGGGRLSGYPVGSRADFVQRISIGTEAAARARRARSQGAAGQP